MDLGLRDSTVLITGAAGSLGRGLVEGFSREGAKLFITDIDENGLRQVSEEIVSQGGTCFYRAADVTSAGEVVKAVSEAARRFEDGIDVLVNTAGMVLQSRIEEMEEHEWDRVFEVNCRGTFLFTRGVVPLMKTRKRGKIINFSSKSGKTGSALLSAYSAAKAAIIGLTQSLAFELAEYGITVNCVCPGLVADTGVGDALFSEYKGSLDLDVDEVTEKFVAKVPLKRLAKIDDIVDAVLYLASCRSDYITGQALNVSGGREMH